ncbi:hypothetical protein D1BOALGB6SA_10302 [Olavius sp. associated proteobacterium Delta 1]|nr:hypothetical protein D1BOALGB6SA_10302 [Olavius sp. associated proteobacterium Delta 1]
MRMTSARLHRVELNPGKISRMSGLHDLVVLNLPAKNAKAMRTAFKVIWEAIRCSREGKILWGEIDDFLQRIEREQGRVPEVTNVALCKARKLMRKAGYIEYRDLHWRFSKRAASALRSLADKADLLQEVLDPAEQGKALHELMYEL